MKIIYNILYKDTPENLLIFLFHEKNRALYLSDKCGLMKEEH